MQRIRPTHTMFDEDKSKQLKTTVTEKFSEGTEVGRTLDAAKGVDPPV